MARAFPSLRNPTHVSLPTPLKDPDPKIGPKPSSSCLVMAKAARSNDTLTFPKQPTSFSCQGTWHQRMVKTRATEGRLFP